MVSDLFGYNSGARNKDEKVPRIGIVMTDGQSGDEVLGPAEAARGQDITLYAIGIGPNVKDLELQQIANDPNEKYVVRVNDFSVVDFSRYRALKRCML